MRRQEHECTSVLSTQPDDQRTEDHGSETERTGDNGTSDDCCSSIDARHSVPRDHALSDPYIQRFVVQVEERGGRLAPGCNNSGAQRGAK